MISPKFKLHHLHDAVDPGHMVKKQEYASRTAFSHFPSIFIFILNLDKPAQTLPKHQIADQNFYLICLCLPYLGHGYTPEEHQTYTAIST